MVAVLAGVHLTLQDALLLHGLREKSRGTAQDDTDCELDTHTHTQATLLFWKDVQAYNLSEFTPELVSSTYAPQKSVQRDIDHPSRDLTVFVKEEGFTNTVRSRDGELISFSTLLREPNVDGTNPAEFSEIYPLDITLCTKVGKKKGRHFVSETFHLEREEEEVSPLNPASPMLTKAHRQYSAFLSGRQTNLTWVFTCA